MHECVIWWRNEIGIVPNVFCYYMNKWRTDIANIQMGVLDFTEWALEYITLI